MHHDSYDIEQTWLKLKKLLKDYEYLDSDIYSFLRRKNKTAAKRIRKQLLDIHKLSLKIRKNVLYQNKENISDYENY